jgi:hypothetical protein
VREMVVGVERGTTVRMPADSRETRVNRRREQNGKGKKKCFFFTKKKVSSLRKVCV